MMNDENTDTPHTDACPHCGAEIRTILDDPYPEINEYRCGTVNLHPSDLCLERKIRQKADAELESEITQPTKSENPPNLK